MSGKPDKIIPEKVVGYESKEPFYEAKITFKEAIIYALGIGFSKDPMDENDLKFTYELNSDFTTFPTIGTTFSDVNKTFAMLLSNSGMPKFNPMMLLHGEQHMEILGQLKPGNSVVTYGKILDVADKGKGASFTFEQTTVQIDENGNKSPLYRQLNVIFIRGLGGFGYKGKISIPLSNPPNRKPCKSIEDKTEKDQAILYRLAGDTNPLHIDPNMAAMGGFDRPILHGLCTYGICAKNVMKLWCDNDPAKIKKIGARFTSHVFPGETLRVNTWKEGPLIIFNAVTVERNTTVILGYVEIHENSAKL